MELSVRLYLLLLTAVATGRLLELRHSKENQRQLANAGSRQAQEPGYKWMVLLHSGVLAGSAAEVLLSHRPWLPWLGIPALLLFVSANAMRWWVIRTLGPRWNVQVMSPGLGVISSGPYRWMRHPNYAAVFVEMLTLPLIHSAWIVALLGTAAHIFVLRNRIQLEESVMMLNADWRAAFAGKSRFLP